MKWHPKKTTSPKYIETTCLLLFVILGGVGVLNHALWRDEMQGWLVAWQSQSWIELWQNNAPSGHPVLWSALIYGVKDLTGTPASMQLLNWLSGVISLILFWCYSHFRTIHKALFTFGFFPFFEYYLISRQYVLAELISFVFCSCYPLRRKTYLPSALCIGLLANSHAFAWAIAFGFGTTLIAEWFWDARHRERYQSRRSWQFDLGLSVAIAISLVGFAAFSLLQVSGSVDYSPWTFDLRHALRVLGRVLGGYTLLIPNSRYWLDLWVCGALSLGLIVSAGLFLRRSFNAFVFFLCANSSLLYFNYAFVLGGGARHYGYYYIILIVALWLCFADKTNAKFPKQSRRSKEVTRRASLQSQIRSRLRAISFYPTIFTAILIVQLGGGLHRFTADLFSPLSAGKAAAAYIRDRDWETVFIVASPDNVMTPIAGYLDRSFYYPEIQGMGSFTRWRDRVPVDRDEVLRQVEEILRKNSAEVDRLLLIVNPEFSWSELQLGDALAVGNLTIEAERRFERSWVGDERYYLYWVSLSPQIESRGDH